MSFLEEDTRTKKATFMPYSRERARECATSALQRLADSRDAKDRLLYASAVKLGIEEVVAELIRLRGRVHTRFESTGRYVLACDDLRSTINSMRSSAEFLEDKDQRMYFARV